MTKHIFVRSFLLAALALPALAQDPATKTTTTVAQGPVLVVKTARPEVAGMMAMNFGHEGELPDLASNAHYVLALGADKKIKVETGAGDVGLMTVTADPGALMEVFAEQLEGGKAMVRGTMTLALQPQGISPKDVAALVDDIFAFPRQVQQLTLKVVGDPEAVAETGLDITLLLEPKAGVPFAATIEAMKPSSQGAPGLPGAEKAALQMRGSIAPESLQKLSAPWFAFMGRMGGADAEQSKQAAAMYEKLLKLVDGGFSAAFGFPFTGHMLFGALDGEAMQKLMTSEEYLAVAKNASAGNRDLSVEVTPNAFEHRGVKVTRTHITNDGPPNPVMPDGTMDSYYAVFANCMTMTLGKEADAKAAFDQVADNKVKRTPLADGVVFDLSLDIKALVAMVQEQMGAPGGPPGDDVPNKATVTLGKRDKALSLHVHVK